MSHETSSAATPDVAARADIDAPQEKPAAAFRLILRAASGSATAGSAASLSSTPVRPLCISV